MANVDKIKRFETVCALTAEYVRAYMQNTNFNLNQATLTEEHVTACFHLAKVTVDLFEREYDAAHRSEAREVLH